MLMQLCFVQFGHNYFITDGKQVVNVLVNKVKKRKQSKEDCVYHVSLPSKTFQAKFKRKDLPPFLIMIAVYTRERLFH